MQDILGPIARGLQNTTKFDKVLKMDFQINHLQSPNKLFLIEIYSMQDRTTTKRHGVTRKR